MRVLVIGAGNVGVVFGYFLKKGGADVAFWVKEKHAEETRRGFTLYPLNSKRGTRWRFEDPKPVVGAAELARESAKVPFDWVILAQPSSGLRGPWFDEVVANAGPRAKFVTLQLGLGDLEWIQERVPRERIYSGMISMIAYHAPLPGESFPEKGMAFWFPPGGPCPFSGPDRGEVESLVAVFKKGGMPAAVASASGASSRFPDFLLDALVTSLDLVGWKFQDLNRTEDVRLAIRSAEQASAILDRRLGTRRPFYYSILTPGFMRGAARAASKLLPLPLEPYLQAHFTKVKPQFTKDRIAFIHEGKRVGLPVDAIEKVHARLDR